MTTKEQERQEIARIRRIVEGLGENSYIGFAMEGVLEMAERNIEDDAAYSMKGCMEIAERREQEQREKAEKLEEGLKAAQTELAQGKAWWKEQQADLKKQLQEAQTLAERYKMPEDMYKSLWMIVSDGEEKAQRGMMDSAFLMQSYVGDTDETEISPKIREAAKGFRKYRARVQECKMLLEMLESKYEVREKR